VDINTKILKFIHIPRTGGTTIENVAKENRYFFGRFDAVYCGNIRKNSLDIFDKKAPMWHSILENKTELVNKFVFFAIIRHPIDKLISEYYRPYIDYNTGHTKNTLKIEKKEKESLETFNQNIFNILKLCKEKPNRSGHFAQQNNFLSIDRKDYLITFDKLSYLCSALFDKYNLKINFSYRFGESKKIYDKSNLSSENITLANEVYNQDMDLFNMLTNYYHKNNNIYITQ
jgi:hypothetical protein